MLTIHFTPSYCKISNINSSLEFELYNLLAYQQPGFYYSNLFQNGNWDGYVRLYYPKTQRFRSGLLPRVISFLQSKNVEYKLLNFPPPSTYNQRSSTYSLRPYQLKVVSDILTKRFGIVQAPPRSGKTLIMLSVIDSERQFPAIYFCRSLDLAMQTIKKVKQFLPDIPVGMIGQGETDIVSNGLNICTIQSVFSAFDKKYSPSKTEQLEPPIRKKEEVRQLLLNAKAVFYDENHHAKGATSKFILDKCTNVNLKIGLSATPFLDSESPLLIESIIGGVISEISYSELIREGYLLRPNIYLYKLPNTSSKGTYQSIYKQDVINNAFLEGLIKKIVNSITKKNQSVVVQTEFINHSLKLGKLLNCEVLTGKDKIEKRKDIIEKLSNKEILCLVSTLFEEGLDIPSLSYTINVAGGLSNISTLQRMRSITVSEGKNTCGIIDFLHKSKYLSRHSNIRKSLYEKEPEFNVKIIDVSKKTLSEIN